MLQLLEKEEVIADLRRGLIQRITDDILGLKTVILTNKRLILINKKMGSFQKKYIFLKDVQSIESLRSFNIAALIASIISFIVLISMLSSSSPSSTPESVIKTGIEFVCLLFGVVLIFSLRTNVFRISTTTEDIDFILTRSISTTRLEPFIELAQIEINKQKRTD